METDVSHSYGGWAREELNGQDDSREMSVSQMLHHSSISFGRFALAPLSWEKRSVFTRNRYQEELENFRAPGLVAQKKAFFEEYYKRIQTMKDLQENQHTDSASNCSDNNGITGQKEEDRSVVPSESDGNDMEKTIGHIIEKASSTIDNIIGDVSTEATFDLEDASTKVTALVDDFPPNSNQWKISDINSYHHERIISITDSKQGDFIRVEKELEPGGFVLESISRQIGVENLRIAENKSYGDEFEYISDRYKISIKEPMGIDAETTLAEAGLPIKSPKGYKMNANAYNFKQSQLLVPKSCDHEPSTENIDETKKLGFRNQEYEKFSKKSVKSKHDRGPSTASVDDTMKQVFISQEYKNFSKKFKKCGQNISCCPTSSPKFLELKLKKEQKKVNQVVKGFKSNVFTPQEKSSQSEYSVKSELKIKSVSVLVKQALCDSSQMRNRKSTSCNVSHKQAIDKIMSSKEAAVASHEPNREGPSKITTPCPFTFTARRKNVASIIATPRSDTNFFLSSSLRLSKSIDSKGVSSRLGTYQGEKNEIRGRDELERKAFIVNGQATDFRGGNASNLISPLKARFVTSCKGSMNAGANYKLARINEVEKRKLIKVVNEESCLKEVGEHGKSAILCNLLQTQKLDNKKMDPSKVKDLSFIMKNLQLGDDSLNRKKKRRPEKPRWQ